MEIKLLVACLAAALVAVCHGCSTGKEFITTFLPNYKCNVKNRRLELVLTAQDSKATVHVKVASLKFSKQVALAAGESRSVSIPVKAELRKQFVNPDSTVRISSSAEISVVSSNNQFATGDRTVVYPMEELGTDYFVYTPTGTYRAMDHLVAIVNGDSPNKITLTHAANLLLRGGFKTKKGQDFSVILKPYDTLLLRGRSNLSGGRIQSQRPVAVLAGHQCLTLSRTCDHVYEQLPPVMSLGKEYLVPNTLSCMAKSWAVVVAVEDNTEVTLLSGRRPDEKKLKKAGDLIHAGLAKKQPMVVKSNKKVMVLFLSTNRPYDPIFMALTSNEKLANDWTVQTENGYDSTMTILSEKEGKSSVKICFKGKCSSRLKWHNFMLDGRWVWASIKMGKKQRQVTVEGDSEMAVYVYGGKNRHSYGTGGVCSQSGPSPPPPVDQCDNVKCRKKEQCENGKCVPISTATCRIMGDPHYRTYDGRRYDFQGSCTYIVTTVIKPGADLVPFTVTTKNNHRGRRSVSFVRTVTVTVYDQTITIDKHRGKVKVNGEFQVLPVRLLDGKIRVRRKGLYSFLITDFGLKIKYDCNMRLIIKVPSSYFEHLGGLCGNYNGDRKDDLPVAAGSGLKAVLEMIKPWKVKDSDLFCHDNCRGRCPSCSKKQQERFNKPSSCGVLTKSDGPFAACHKNVQPASYLENCVYDVCINKGAKQFLCDNLKSYEDACQSQGVKINPQWRMITKCPLNCPKGSHYEACGSACPLTCSSLDSEKQCNEPCVEGCLCDEGLVLSGDRCVPLSSCGCQYKGKYYPPGNFWADNTCTTKCKCVRGGVQCKQVTCKKSEHCALKKGVRDCYPASYSTCQGSGDPHYMNFDKRRFDFQGVCTYVLSQVSKKAEEDLERFQVLVKNENRGRNKKVAYTKSTSLTVFGNITVSMSRASPGRMLVNGLLVNLPYSMEDGQLSLYRRCSFGIVKTSFGLTLAFNWKSHVSLTLPSSYMGATEGLCGNFNGKRDDDFMTSGGTLTKIIDDFGNSWKAGEDISCPSGRGGSDCGPEMRKQYESKQFCGIISSPTGPFRHCQSKVDHSTALQECAFDMCAYKGHSSALCNSLTSFNAECQAAGATVENWRTENFCPASCQANSHYEKCVSPCQPTCRNLAPPEGCDEDAPCAEGCVCEDGFILSDDRCVPVAECGCLYSEQYYKNGQVFHPGQSCDNRCVCSEGEVVCDSKFSCSAHENCVVKDGMPTCSPKGFGSCSVRGHRTVRSYDGQEYPLWGDCTFKLSEVEENEALEDFSVLVQQQSGKSGGAIRSVTLKVYDMEITMESGVVWASKLENLRVSLPTSLADKKVQLTQNGLNIILETDFGLKLIYDTVSSVFLKIPSTYNGLPQGLCGNYNGKVSDDPVAGKKPEEAAALWVEDKEETPCETGCGKKPCPQPDGQTDDRCKIITDAQGPFAGCHSKVKPGPNYDNCVKEMSTGSGDKTHILCRHIQNYVTDCQLAGGNIKEWRKKDFCPLTCPAGSHYELCTSSCTTTCYSLEESDTCILECQEGCECDDGLLSDGFRCVPADKCGCTKDGQYYMDDTSVLVEECTKRCTCHSGVLTCTNTSCTEAEECRNKDGVLGCVSKDPCAELECRVKEHCNVSEGKAECVPDSTAMCFAYGDPHYVSLDGKQYSFQGTCSYILVNVTGPDSTLPPFTVITKNELRGNSEGSFVRSTTVDIMGFRITIPRKDRGNVLVDGIKTALPVLLEDNSISIIQTGIRGRIQTDIGVEITFDWSTLVIVSLSSSYYGNVEGLCGNYNGNQKDELIDANGNLSPNVTVWAETFSVPDGDPFCYHHCDGECPDCSEEDRKKYSGPDYCGILSDKKGPFSGCHSKLPAEEFSRDCLYDVCLSEGRYEVLCEALSSYMTECQEVGAPVLPWRQLTNCTVTCPEHSHYKECGSACPPSCGPQPEVCTKQCVEGCFCDKGYVLSRTGCVIRETGCGCTVDGHYYQPGEEFWADSKCEMKGVCDGATQKVRYNEAGCRKGEKCDVVDGVQGCYPTGFGTCTARGDPHFKGFDKRKFDFQGNCVYRLTSVCGDTKGLVPFEVLLENNNRGNNKKVSYAKVVTVKVYGKTFTMSVSIPRRVLVDGMDYSVPFSFNETLIQANHKNRWTVLETSFLKVFFDYVSSVRVELATSYQGSVCGLCGNFNDNPADDLMMPDGKQAADANAFGVSHWVANVEGCSRTCENCPKPQPPSSTRPPYTAVCDIIKAKDGPLNDCVGRLPSEEFYEDCVYDMIQKDGDQDTACNIITDYVDECQRVGGCVRPWRTRRFCWKHCPKHSSYSVIAPGCPVSCTDLSPAIQCKIPPSEGCVCHPGYVLSQDSCVPLAECGCQYKGQYLTTGYRFYIDDSCQRKCACHGGTVACETDPCKGNESCGFVDGVRGCYAKKEIKG